MLKATPHLWISVGTGHRPITVKTGQPVCVRVAVPPVQFGEGKETLGNSTAKYDQDESDGLIVWAYSETTGLRKGLSMKPWHGYSLATNMRNISKTASGLPKYNMRIYEAELQLYDADYYQFDGLVEKHLGGSSTPWRLAKSQELLIVNAMFPPHKRSLESRASLPLCYGSDSDGRWLAKDKITFGTSMRPVKKKSTEFMVQRNDDQVAWVPYDCQDMNFKLQSLRTCIQRTAKKVHWYVDAEDRGVFIRKFWSHGRWCGRQDAWRERCACADPVHDWDIMKSSYGHIDIQLLNQTEFSDRSTEREGVLSGERVDHVDIATSTLQANESATPLIVEIDPKITAIKFGGLAAEMTPPNTTLDPFESSYLDYLDNKDYFKTPGLVVFGLPLRDIKTLSFAEYDERLTRLIKNFKYRYSMVPIIYRSFRYSCCGKEGLTSDRIEIYERHTRKRVVEELDAEVWDIWTMGRDWSTASDYIQNQQCRGSHSLPHGLIEAQSHVLVNAICNELNG
ncbi:unnamed protein product [Umbelopsis vinacea]